MKKDIKSEIKRIAEEKRALNTELQITKQVFKLLGNGEYSFNVCSPMSKPFVSFHCDTLAEASYILRKIPAVNETTSITTGKGVELIQTPYKVWIKHYINSEGDIQIQYVATGFDVWVTVKASLLSQFIRYENRPVSSSELHYFAGYKAPKTVMSLTFNSGDVVNYGNMKVQKSVFVINDMVNAIHYVADFGGE